MIRAATDKGVFRDCNEKAGKKMSETQSDNPGAEVADFEPKALDSILSRAEEPAEEEKPEASSAPSSDDKTPSKPEEKPESSEKKPDEKGEKKADDTGDKKADSPPESEKEDDSKSHSVPLAVVMDERERRKQAEARAAELEKQLNSREGETQRPSVFDNEEAFRSDIEGRALQMAESRVFKMSEHLAVEQYGEETVQSAVNRLAELVKEDQQLAVRFRDAPSPFHEAVKIVQEKEKVQAALDGSLEKEIEERVRAEIKSEAEKKQAEEDEIPSSLAAVSSNGVGAGSTWQGPTPIEKALQ